MTRLIHYISENKNREIPHHLLVVDTETFIEKSGEFSEKQTFRLGYAIYLWWNSRNGVYYEQNFPLKSVDDFHKLLDSILIPKRKLVIFSHNSSFDYSILMMDTYFSSRNFEISMRVIDQIFLIRAFKKSKDGQSSIVYSDTMNYYKMSLQKLGEIFGEYKMKTPDFTNVSDSDLMKYCRQDTKILATLMKKHIQFIAEHDLGNFKMTIASQAFNAFRHRFMKSKILIHTFDDIIQLELSSYRGGRCEAFIIGKRENIFKLDVNSMYPFVMKQYRYPIKPLSNTVLTNLSIADIEDGLKTDKFILAECNLILNEPVIAVKKKKLFFPIGRITQTITSPEIEYILKNPEIGNIKSIKKCVFYHQESIFKEYVDYFYNFRKSTTNLAYQAMAKLFLNSLYGKFGQKSMSAHTKIDDHSIQDNIFELMNDLKTNVVDKLIDDKLTRYIRLAEDLYCIENSSEILAYDSSPIIASAVTSYARMYLFELIKTAGLSEVFYCDTDSLFVSEIGYNNLKTKGLISPTELGKLKHEDTGNMEIFGAKNYSFNDETKLKGIKKDARLISPNKYIQSQFITKNLKYRKGIQDGMILVQPIIKQISMNYDKGMVKNGTIFPLEFNDF